MGTTNDLLKYTEQLGGVRDMFNGAIFARKPLKDNPDQFYIVMLNFTSQADLIPLKEIMDKLGLVGFTDIINLKVADTEVSASIKSTLPICPDHGPDDVAPSKKQPGWVYCKRKRFDGTFCKWKAPYPG